jgi:zinc dependent phospholipase C
MPIVAAVVLACLGLVAPHPARAFSVLAHQAIVDRSWDDAIVPALRARFGRVSREDLERAHAFAWGGSHIADLGYFPLGNREFTDLVHYVRSGDFVTALVEEARTPDEYAFALGALSHYIGDDTGHPEATNRVVPELYPKLRRQYGEQVTYADDHASHLKTEFRFDVLALAQRKQTPDLFDHAIAFAVSEPLLDRAFQRTYGLRLDDLFASTDVAITTYRWAFRSLVHEATGIAWQLYRADIQRLDPAATPARFVHDMSRADFEKQFGDAYREPGYFARFVAFLVKLVPDVGPFERLPYKPLPAEAQARFTRAVDHAVARYRTAVADARAHRLRLPNDVLDTGQRARRGEYEPADDAYEALMEKLADRDVASVPAGLRADVLRFYGAGSPDDDEARAVLAELRTTPR